MTRYFWGVASALLAGVCLNLGYLFQKLAVNRLPKQDFKVTRLLTMPLWLAGISLQLFVGIGLFALAQSYIGPSLVPGLMALGIVVLEVGSNLVLKEAFSLSGKIGIVLIVVAIFFIGISGLNINMMDFNLREAAFLFRLAIFNFVYLFLTGLCLSLQLFLPRLKGLVWITAAGLLFSLTNLWISIVVGLWGQNGNAVLVTPVLWYFLIALGLTIGAGVCAVFLTQEALEAGEVGILIPVQNVPIQLTPALLYFYVFNLPPGSVLSLTALSLGILLIILGSFLLARRRRKPA